MKIVRCGRAELEEWRLNISHLVDDEGHLVEKLDRSVETAIATVLRSAKSQNKSLTQLVAIGTPPNQRQRAISVEVRRNGVDISSVSTHVRVDGYRVVSGRDVLCARMFAQHGECQLRRPNGTILRVARDPSVRRPTFAESQQIAPKPEHCTCRSWGRPHPGTHYPTCPYNRLAPPEERAPSDVVSEEEIRILPAEALSALKLPTPAAPASNVVMATVAPATARETAVDGGEPLDPPDSCRNGCLSWATPKGYPIPPGQHHPTCTFAHRWAVQTAREEPRWLVDLKTGEKVRRASTEESAQGDIARAKTGTPIIHIDDNPYAVVLERELADEALAEATASSSSGAAA